ncbi:MAG: LytR C-terminal domain-containing protein [candidate division Zixibacteria bacterium]|nr:LytR C-terminal domain-containing protein [candidate division Zixibacteria bacterium]
MSQNRKTKNLKSYRSKVTGKKAKSGRRLDYLLVLVSVLVLAFVGSFALKYSVGESSPDIKPPSIVRFQVLNGCGIRGAAARFSGFLREKSSRELIMDVIDESNFKSFDQERTLLITRNASAAEVELVVAAIGLPPEQVVHRKLDDNFLDINFTIVLGKDCDSVLSATNGGR